MTGGSAAETGHTLKLRRTFDFPREQVFEAWTAPEALEKWWGGGLADTVSAVMHLRPGGSYRLTMRSGDRPFAMEGVYRQVEPPERLGYTWRWEGLELDDGDESLVTVEFLDADGATEIVVIHEGIESGGGLAFHQEGWDASLRSLAELLAG